MLRAHHDRFAVYRRESSRPHPPLMPLSTLAEIERATDTPRTESPRTEVVGAMRPDPSRTGEPVRAEPRYPSFVSSMPPEAQDSSQQTAK